MAQEPTGSPEDSGPPQSCPGLCRTPLCLLTWEGLSQVRTRGGCQGRAASEWGPWQAWEPQSPFRSPLGADELSCGFLASRAFFISTSLSPRRFFPTSSRSILWHFIWFPDLWFLEEMDLASGPSQTLSLGRPGRQVGHPQACRQVLGAWV